MSAFCFNSDQSKILSSGTGLIPWKKKTISKLLSTIETKNPPNVYNRFKLWSDRMGSKASR